MSLIYASALVALSILLVWLIMSPRVPSTLLMDIGMACTAFGTLSAAVSLGADDSCSVKSLTLVGAGLVIMLVAMFLPRKRRAEDQAGDYRAMRKTQ